MHSQYPSWLMGWTQRGTELVGQAYCVHWMSLAHVAPTGGMLVGPQLAHDELMQPCLLRHTAKVAVDRQVLPLEVNAFSALPPKPLPASCGSILGTPK